MMLAVWILSLFVAAAVAKPQFWGVAIAGGDFGCQIDGSCPTGNTQVPLTALGHADGAGQMQHFVQDDQFNVFRLPISWQWLVNNALGGPLDSHNFGQYDQLVQACLKTGAYCMLDVHNFARWNGRVIGQNGATSPTDDDFVNLWKQLATHYASEPKLLFGIMNEPHDLNVTQWAATCQKVVTAIRNVGANQLILLPGTNFDSAALLVSSGSADALMAIRNPDGSFTNLVLDVHKYLDFDNSGEHAECAMDNIGNFSIVANYLRSVGRQGIVSETGAGTYQSTGCFTDFCAQNSYIAANSDVFLGLIAWSAGAFPTDYILSLTPTLVAGKYYDNAMCWQCVVGPWLYPNQTVPALPTPPPNAGSQSKPANAASRPGDGILGGAFAVALGLVVLMTL